MIQLEEIYAKADCPSCEGVGEVELDRLTRYSNPRDPGTAYQDLVIETCATCGGFGRIFISATLQIRPDDEDRWVLEVETHHGDLHDVYINIVGVEGEPGVNWFESRWADNREDDILAAI